MSRLAKKEIDWGMDRCLEIQSAVRLLGRRLEAISSMEFDEMDKDEILSLSRVTDLCANLLDGVAELLERVIE